MPRCLQPDVTDDACGQGRVGKDGQEPSNTGKTKPTDRVSAVPELQGEMGQEEAATRITEKAFSREESREEMPGRKVLGFSKRSVGRG